MSLNRMTMPSEFQDRISEVVLRQPEPEYFGARVLFMASAQAEVQRTGVKYAGPGRAEGIGEMGAAYPGLMDMALVLNDKVRGEAIVVSDELAKGKSGTTILFNRPRFTNTTYTRASRLLLQGAPVSTTAIDVAGEQVSLTIEEIAGPYDTGNSRVAPYAIDRFDAEHSAHRMAETVGMHLQRDRMRYVDSRISTMLQAVTGTKIFPSDPSFGQTVVATAFAGSTGGMRTLDFDTVVRGEQKLVEASIPKFSNGTYWFVVDALGAQQLRNDPSVQKQAVFDPGLNPLRNSFIARIGNVEVYQSTTLPTDTTTVSGDTIHTGCMFGPGMIGYASGGPVMVDMSSDDDFNRSVKVIWHVYEALDFLDSSFGVPIYWD